MKKVLFHNSKNCKWYKYLKMKRLTLPENKPIYKWLFWLYFPNKYEYQKILYKQGQRTFVYCPHCDTELISSNSYVDTDVPLLETYFKCTNCMTVSSWDFNTPVPVLLQNYGNKDRAYKQLRNIGYYDTQKFKQYSKQLMEELDNA